MKRHPESAAVQEQGCWALGNLAVNADNQVNAGNQLMIADAGGVEAVVEAMKRHPESAAVQDKGCGALWSLACNADNKVKIAGAGGVEA
eukprot:377640-Rhodomonas_salina.1